MNSPIQKCTTIREPQVSFAELLAEVAEQHELELTRACRSLEDEKKRLQEDSANLRKELEFVRNAKSDGSSKNGDILAETQSSLVLLPHQPRHNDGVDDDGIEVMTLEKTLPIYQKTLPISRGSSIEIESMQSVNHKLSKNSKPCFEPRLKPPDEVKPPENSAPRRMSSTMTNESPEKIPSRAKLRRQELFPDAEALKDEIRNAVLKKPAYCVESLYYDTGYCQMIARSAIFENVTFAVIFAVTIWLAIDADHNTAKNPMDAHPVFIIGSNCFCLYFTTELAIRFGSFRHKLDIFKDYNFMFDALLVLQDIVETWAMSVYLLLTDKNQESPSKFQVLRMLRMAKLFRMGRAVRLMRALPELAILVKGISIATRSVFFTLLLLMLIIYVFAITFRQLTADTEMGEQYFPTVPSAINSLLLDGILPDNAQIVNDLAEQDWYLWPIIMFFLLLAALTVMNMLVGVLVEVVGTVADAEKESMAVMEMREQLVKVMAELDGDETGCISKSEFGKILVNRNAARLLNEIGVDVVGLVDLADFIFEDYGVMGELDLEDFMRVVLDLRETNTAKVKDVVMMQKLLKRDLQIMMGQMSDFADTFQLAPQVYATAGVVQKPRTRARLENDEESV